MSQDPHSTSLGSCERTDTLRVSVLSEALPYIQRFAGRRVVVKYGGAAMVRDDLRDAAAHLARADDENVFEVHGCEVIVAACRQSR